MCLCLIPLHVPAPWDPWDRGQRVLALQGRAGQEASLAGKGHLLSQALSAVLRTWGGSKLSREQWLCTRGGTGGAELQPKQENNPWIQQQRRARVGPVPWWARWGKQKPGRGKPRREVGMRILILALSSTSNSPRKDSAAEGREHCLKGKGVQ